MEHFLSTRHGMCTQGTQEEGSACSWKASRRTSTLALSIILLAGTPPTSIYGMNEHTAAHPYKTTDKKNSSMQQRDAMSAAPNPRSPTQDHMSHKTCVFTWLSTQDTITGLGSPSTASSCLIRAPGQRRYFHMRLYFEFLGGHDLGDTTAPCTLRNRPGCGGRPGESVGLGLVPSRAAPEHLGPTRPEGERGKLSVARDQATPCGHVDDRGKKDPTFP